MSRHPQVVIPVRLPPARFIPPARFVPPAWADNSINGKTAPSDVDFERRDLQLYQVTEVTVPTDSASIFRDPVDLVFKLTELLSHVPELQRAGLELGGFEPPPDARRGLEVLHALYEGRGTNDIIPGDPQMENVPIVPQMENASFVSAGAPVGSGQGLQVGPTGRRKPKRSNSDAFWGRMGAAKTPEALKLNDNILSLMQQGPRFLLKESARVRFNQPITEISPTHAKIFAQRIRYMLSLEMLADKSLVAQMIMCVFFFIAEDTDAKTWNDKHKYRKRLDPLPNSQVQVLYVSARKGGLVMTVENFSKKLHEWRKYGSCYAFIAWRFGLGALLHLANYLGPKQVGIGFTKRGVRGQPVRMAALRKLRKLGLVELAERSGANEFMHKLLWKTVDVFDGPENWKHEGKTRFPVFDGDLSRLDE
ncbi:hypothetical protein BCR34DRAFT_588586 [Clohesyomyces aquaticus]|uniref:Uncharacterized protein n=1 Tax=Clohesyomyces aquaticus TaxID=1231657 RepID=A0A1Y1ZJT7_9PLEO|nr:hypothetical protein BCR34DRAFT_588586 [Clohesyomyces aquaticus]